MQTTFKKRIYSTAIFRSLLEEAVTHFADVRQAEKHQHISKGFSERIMLAVTEVNGCKYCSYVHTKNALEEGMSEDDVRMMLSGDLSEAPAEENTALLFAQHYAESIGKPEEAASQTLLETYGEESTRDILAIIRTIMVANLHGTALEALGDRIKGKPAEGTTFGQEVSIVLGIFFFIPEILVRNWLGTLFSRRKIDAEANIH